MRKYLVELALKLVGTPYIWGGACPWVGLDCSGFVVWVYQVFGILPSGDWTAQSLREHFWGAVHQEVSEFRPGDLVFYGVSTNSISHVMLFLGGGLVIGASGGDHTTTTREEACRRGAAVKVKPLNYRHDFVDALRPHELVE